MFGVTLLFCIGVRTSTVRTYVLRSGLTVYYRTVQCIVRFLNIQNGGRGAWILLDVRNTAPKQLVIGTQWSNL